jgi:hypothetical protein
MSAAQFSLSGTLACSVLGTVFDGIPWSTVPATLWRGEKAGPIILVVDPVGLSVVF